MQTKRRNIPTIEGVTRKIQAFELRYRITTEEFLRANSSEFAMDEDDAMEWRYLHEQLSALQEDAIERMYRSGRNARLTNSENTSELLAA